MLREKSSGLKRHKPQDQPVAQEYHAQKAKNMVDGHNPQNQPLTQDNNPRERKEGEGDRERGEERERSACAGTRTEDCVNTKHWSVVTVIPSLIYCRTENAKRVHGHR
jgi:hypothetical protein